MSAITSTVTAITEMVQGQLEAVPFDPLIGQPTRHSVRQLIDELAGFTSHFSSSHWGGRHGYLSLVLFDAEMRLVTGDAALDCSRLPLPAHINTRITDATVGHALLQLKEEHKVECQEYTFQTVLYAISVKAIVADVDDQYVEELSEDYIGYKNQTIATMITHLQTCFVITNKEKLDMKALFYAPWSGTPNTHITTFA